MQLRVTQFGEPILREKGTMIEQFDEGLAALATDMIETMYAAEGIGLAAQQIGRALQLFVMDLQLRPEDVHFEYTYDGKQPPLELIMPLTVVNPKVEAFGDEDGYEEGCLSFGDIRGAVKRPLSVNMQFQDVAGNPHTVECDGIFARCILHEYDHLQGVLFIDRMETRVVRNLETQLKKLKRASRDFLKQQKSQQ